MKIQDSLDKQQQSYNFSSPALNNNLNSKNSMQYLYKQQLDYQMQERKKRKQQQHIRELAQKKQFNQRAINNKESEKLKEQAYKNYYQLLMNNHQYLQNSYVSPYSVRDNMKDEHINHSIQESQARQHNWQMQQKKRQIRVKNDYRSELMSQIQERRKKQQKNKFEQQRKNEQYKRFGQLPKQIDLYQRRRHIDQMNKYRQDLDRLKDVKQSRNKSRSQQLSHKVMPLDQRHNTIINPMPYNIQNPYILKDMSRQPYISKTSGIQ